VPYCTLHTLVGFDMDHCSKTTALLTGQIKQVTKPKLGWFWSIETCFSTRTALCTPQTGGVESCFGIRRPSFGAASLLGESSSVGFHEPNVY
jgi:hypothetical protein